MNRHKGFTLIEVVVAFVLLTVVLVLAFEVFSAGLARASELENRSRALAIAQSLLATSGIEQQLKEGESRGESEDRRFQWVVHVAKTNDGVEPGKPAPSVYSLYRVDVLVTWQGTDGRALSLPLSTLQIWTTG